MAANARFKQYGYNSTVDKKGMSIRLKSRKAHRPLASIAKSYAMLVAVFATFFFALVLLVVLERYILGLV
jgi:hypothetical protein